jgi:hypothetical protein
MQAIASEISVLTAGNRLIDPPEIEKLYSATEIGEMCGISANIVGRIAKRLELKTEEYGIYLLGKSPYSLKQVTVFHYKRRAANRIVEFLDAVRGPSATDAPLIGEFDLSGIYP